MNLEDFMPIIKNIAFALTVAIIGIIVINNFIKRLEKRFVKVRMDETLKPFFLSVLKVGLKILLALVIIKIIGIDTSSFVAVLASAGFAVGLAFQGSLSNFSGGVLLLTMRPFKVGDFIETSGHSGFVKAIKILYTELLTTDNKAVFIPNGGLANSSIINYTMMDTRRVDFRFNVSYSEDIEKVKKVILKVIHRNEMILKEPEELVRIIEHGKDAIVFVVRVWTLTENYWDVYFDIMENVKREFDKESIKIPFSQIDVNVRN